MLAKWQLKKAARAFSTLAQLTIYLPASCYKHFFLNNTQQYMKVNTQLHNRYLNHLSYVALWPGVVCLILHSHQHYKVEVIPHVVLIFYVLFKGHGLVVKLVPFKP